MPYETGSLEGDLAKAKALTTQQYGNQSGGQPAPTTTTQPPVPPPSAPFGAPSPQQGATVPVSVNPSTQVPSSSLANPTTQMDWMAMLQKNLANQDRLLQDVSGYYTPTQQELDDQKRLNDAINAQQNFDVSYEGGLQKIAKQPIALEFQQGQQAALTRDAAFTRSSLARQVDAYTRVLQSTQANRQQKLEAAKFLYDSNRNSLSDTITLMKATAPENIGNVVDPQTGEMTVIMKNPVDGTVTKQSLGVVQTPQRVIDNVKTAQDAGVTQPFWSRDGKTVINTNNGREYSTLEQAAADGVDTQSWSNVQWGVKTLPQQQLDLQREQLAATKYQAVTNPVTGESMVFNPKTGKFTSVPGQTSNDPSLQPYFGLGPKLFDAGQKIATQFDNEKVVQNFNVINEAKSFVDSLPSDSNSPADDQGLLYAFAKAMDPNSVVREGEYATVQKYAQSWLETFGFNAKRVVDNGEFLTKEARDNLKGTINKKFDASLGNYQNVHDEYSRRIDQATGKSGVGNLFITDYNKAYNQGGGDYLSVQTPDGQTFSFPDENSMLQFKKAAGLGLDLNSAQSSGGLDFGTGNQVKGMQQKAAPLAYIDVNTLKPSKFLNTQTLTGLQGNPAELTTAAMAKFAPGTTGGQCGVFVRNIANSFGLNYPTLGDSLQSKMNAVKKYGTSPQNAGTGSVIVTKENPTYGHVAWVIGKNAQGYIVAESNYKQSNKISYGRVIPFNSSAIIGIINPKLS